MTRLFFNSATVKLICQLYYQRKTLNLSLGSRVVVQIKRGEKSRECVMLIIRFRGIS